ncbi:hypothetical protein SUGI_0052380 [Cryptomeria japonica]|uniref:uncharacterized protein LOC131070937 n=1 Tax=Cryptomeria japonica TaxID=3369 RepID=UPI002408BFE4|nr:uncharacterized protein LOC131070937 [Cryptomeria japonica]GLJ06915.1 hypothetical protein SUGI_0052380 [Cryptomeria japonica]
MAMRLIFPCTAATGNTDRITHGNAVIRLISSNANARANRRGHLSICPALSDKDTTKEGSSSVEQVTKKYGLEAGLWKIFTTKDDENGEDGKEMKKNQAKQLLARYGGAYLATSISLSVVSFTVCYLLINAGVDVQGLLDKVGIHTNETGEKVGTFALAYAAHKAASPIRFPPTVALTPMVAGWFGKKSKDKEENKIT